MSAMKQIVAVVGMNTRALRTRAAASLVVVVGMAAVVGVALSVFSLSAGMTRMIKSNSPPDTMVIFSQGADNEGTSNIPHDAVPTIADTPGIKKGPDGKPLISAEVESNLFGRQNNGYETYVTIRGVGSDVFSVRSYFKLSEGRMFTPGRHEMIAGKAVVARFANMGIGSQVRFQDGPWTVVGIYETTNDAGGDIVLLADAETLLAAMRRTTFGMVVAKLEDGTKSAQDQFVSALKANPAVSVEVETQESYMLRMAQGGTNFYRFLAFGVGGIMGLGAVFAALNTMYAAVAARLVEIATLRAIGFGAASVVISVIVEGLALAVIGAALGALVVWLVFNGRVQHLGYVTINQAVTPQMMVAGIGLSLIVGLVGALFPAIRAARLPVAAALRAAQ